MSDPILTLEQAVAWLDANGVYLELEIVREAAHWPYKWSLQEAGDAGRIAYIEAVRQVAERDDAPTERVTPCPPSEVGAARKALAAGMRTVVVMIGTLRRGANELGLHDVARVLWKMGADLSSLAGKVGA